MFLFLVFINGCAKHNPINFSSSDAFFSSFEEKKLIKQENKNSTPVKNKLKENDIKKTEKQIIKKPFKLSLSSYEKQLEKKIGYDELTILKIFKKPNLIIKHGEIKNLQFHLKFCHLDLFFLYKDLTYIFKHFDIRPPNISSNLDKKKCVKELNDRFILIRDLK